MISTIAEYERTDTRMAAALADVIAEFGAPAGLGEVELIAAACHGHIVRERARLAARQREAIAARYAGLIWPSARVYPMGATLRMAARAAGLKAPKHMPRHRGIDPAALALAAAPAGDDDEEITAIYGRRLIAGAARHAKAAGRDFVLDTARINRARWARVLNSGACAWCAMQASRGAVFSKDTAHFAAHDHCNCDATLAIGRDWEGRGEAALLAQLWRKAGRAGFDRFSELYRQEIEE